MQQFRILIACTTVLAVALMLSACGDDTEALDPVQWPFLESTQKLQINGNEFEAYIAKTEMHRRRALNGIAIKEKQAIAYLFPAQDEAVKLRFINMPDPVELVWLDGSGKVLDINKVPAFSQSTFPHQYAAKGARVILQLRDGAAKEAGITKGSNVKTEPNLLDESKEAGAEFASIFFLSSDRPEEKPEDAPSVQLKVLEKPEEVAQFVKDRDDLKEGQGVLIPLSSELHEFWLKEAKGKWCGCYLESAGRFRTTVISAVYEGIEAKGGSDLEEPIYYAPAAASHLALWKGSDFFSKNDIERRSPVAVAGVDVMSAEKVTYDDLEIKFGETRLEASLARTEDERKAALLDAKSLESGKAIVLAWDDPSQVKIEAPAGVNLWYVKADGGKYTIGEKHNNTTAGVIAASAGSRFVLAVPAGFEAQGELKFPYALRDLKPTVEPLVFYKAKQKDVVTDRWPGKDDNFKQLAHVELAITDAEQTRGLMYRTSLKKNHGMAFLYDAEEEELTYWMKNCRMNLSIAFVDEKGVIVKIHNVMKAPEPGTPDSALERYESGRPAKYAIEFEENWYKNNNIEEGDRVFFPPRLVAGE
ncbi:MAG: DUF192 domain-containing protein [Planctomycetes bacterium]|nr:DUF192 domain-containing protein [Planctomycetota bacterium]MCA8935526.1 DUF192 domain-containing protein [Planctomycetota bacterium]